MLVSKIQTYLGDKMHLKKIIAKNMLSCDLRQKWLGQNCWNKQ
jgi:hypothetical protein